METRSKHLALVGLWILGLSACTRGGGPFYNPEFDPRFAGLYDDAGAQDAGSITADAGDAGDRNDAGSGTPDGGQHDAGLPQDAGLDDAGAAPMDAGNTDNDAGLPAMDAGTPPCTGIPLAPVIHIEPVAPTTEDDLDVHIDNRPVDCELEYEVSWSFKHKDDGSYVAHDGHYSNDDVPPGIEARLPARYTRKDYTWQAIVVAKTFAGEASSQAQAMVTVANSVPSVSASLPVVHTSRSDLVLSFEVDDPDADDQRSDGKNCETCGSSCNALDLCNLGPQTIEWRVNGTKREELSNPNQLSVPKDLLAPGQTWAVTIVVTDGQAESAAESASVTINNDAPVVESVVVVSTDPNLGAYPTVAAPLRAYVDARDPDDPTNPNALTITWSWLKKSPDTGAVIPVGLDAETLSPEYFSKSDLIKVRVTASDSAGVSVSMDSAYVEIADSIPALTSVALVSADETADRISAGANIICESTVEADADGDPFALSYRWERNEAPINGATSNELDPVTFSVATNDRILCEVSLRQRDQDDVLITLPGAMSARATVDNAYPVVDRTSLVISVDGTPQIPGKFTARDTLACGTPAVDDPDVTLKGDVLGYRVTWSETFSLPDASNPGAELTYEVIHEAPDPTQPTLPPNTLKRGNKVTCNVTPIDYDLSGVQLSSGRTEKSLNTVTIANTPPSVGAVRIIETAPSSIDEVTCVASGADDYDRDPVSFEYAWFAISPDANGNFPTTDPNTGTYPMGTVMAPLGPAVIRDREDPSVFVPTQAVHAKGGQRLVCRVRPFDGADYGRERLSAGVIVGNSAPTVTGAKVEALDPSGNVATPRADSTFRCVGIQPYDMDDDDVLYDNVLWYVNDEQPVSGNGEGLLHRPSLVKGDRIRCKLTPRDALGGVGLTTDYSATLTIPDTAPSFNVLLSPAQPTTAGDVTCTGVYDDPDEGDPSPAPNSFTIQWYELDNNQEVLLKECVQADGCTLAASNLFWTQGAQQSVKCRATVAMQGQTIGPAETQWIVVGNGPPKFPENQGAEVGFTNLDQNRLPNAYSVLTVAATGATDPDVSDNLHFLFTFQKQSQGLGPWIDLVTIDTRQNGGQSSSTASMNPEDDLSEEQRYGRGDKVRVAGYAVDSQGGTSNALLSAELEIGNAPPQPAGAAFVSTSGLPFSDASEETRPARHGEDLQCDVVLHEDYGVDANGAPTDFDGDPVSFTVEWSATGAGSKWPPSGYTGTSDNGKVWISPDTEGVRYPFKTTGLAGDTVDRHYLPATAKSYCRMIATDAPGAPETPESAPGVASMISWKDGPWRFVVDTQGSNNNPDPQANGGLLECPAGSCTLRAAMVLAQLVQLSSDPMGSRIEIPSGSYTLTKKGGEPDVMSFEAPVELHGTNPETPPTLVLNRALLASLPAGTSVVPAVPGWGLKVSNIVFDIPRVPDSQDAQVLVPAPNVPSLVPLLDIEDGLGLYLNDVKFDSFHSAIRLWGGHIEGSDIEVIGNPSTVHHAIEVGTDGSGNKRSTGYIAGLSVSGHSQRANIENSNVEVSALSVYHVDTFELSDAYLYENWAVNGGHIKYTAFPVSTSSPDRSEFTLRNSVLEKGHTVANGGAIYMSGSGDLVIANSQIIQNDAAASGGGIYAKAPGITVSITDSQIDSNTASEVSQGGGAGVWITGAGTPARLELSGTTIGAGLTEDCTTTTKANRIAPKSNVLGTPQGQLQGAGVYARYAQVLNPDGSANPSAIRCNKIYTNDKDQIIATGARGAGVNILSGTSSLNSNGIDISGNEPEDKASGNGPCTSLCN